MLKTFDCVDHNKLWKILQDIGIPDHLTCLLQNLYAVQEATVRTRHRTMGRVYDTAIYCQPAYLTSSRVHHAKCQLDESQAGINIVGRNINNLTYADATTQVVESEEELKRLLMSVRVKKLA